MGGGLGSGGGRGGWGGIAAEEAALSERVGSGGGAEGASTKVAIGHVERTTVETYPALSFELRR